MDSLIVSDALVHTRISYASVISSTSTIRYHLPCFLSPPIRGPPSWSSSSLFKNSSSHNRNISVVNGTGGAVMANSTPQPRNGVYTVGDFMTKKEELHVVKPTTTVNEALEILVDNRITGFPVIDDDWKLILFVAAGWSVSDYDLLALDSISGGGVAETSMFPEADSSWKTFNEIQKLLSKTNGQVIADVMTSAPLVVRETTNLEDAARLLLETKYRRFPVVDSKGTLVGIITRGNVVRAALHVKREIEKKA